jgi:hypothetical protein
MLEIRNAAQYLKLVLANFFKPITDEDFSNFQVSNINRTDFI